MHFLIPDTTNNLNSNGGSFTTYNLHINGSLHSSIRYNDFYNFNEKLSEDFLTSILPNFPPKKLFPLINSQIESRRIALERYIQMVSMNSTLKRSDVFNHFIRNAQQRMLSTESEAVSVDVYLANGQHASISDALTTTSKCADVLRAFVEHVKLDEALRSRFAVYLVRRMPTGDIEVVRTIQDFECPAISIQLANKTKDEFCLMIRKSYWDPKIDEQVFKDKIATNLLYSQIVNENLHGWTQGDVNELKELKKLRKKADKKQYILESQRLDFYGNERFLDCTSDYSGIVLNCNKITVHQVTVYISYKELVIQDMTTTNAPLKDTVFKITRIRCWRLINTEDRDDIDCGDVDGKVQLKFEYLFAPNVLRWVSVYSDQAIFMSMCLQSVVNELIMKKGYSSVNTPVTVAMNTDIQNKPSRVADWALKAVGGGGGGSPTSKKKHHNDYNQNTTTSEAFECIGDDDL